MRPINVWPIPRDVCLCYCMTVLPKAADAFWCVCTVQYVQTCVEYFAHVCMCISVYWWVCASGMPPLCMCAPWGLGHGLLLILCESRYGALQPLLLWPIGACGNGRIQQKIHFLSAGTSPDSTVNWDHANSTVTPQVNVLIQMCLWHFEGQILLWS